MTERYLCPNCESIRMVFIWPSPQEDPEVEAVIGRLQECRSCGWQGDVETGDQFFIRREDAIYWLDDTPFKSVRSVLESLDLL